MEKVMRFFLPIVLLSLMASLAIMEWGCETTSTGPEEGYVPDTTTAETKVQEANAALGLVLYAWINNPEIEDPSEVDFTVPYNLYTEAYNLDHNNVDANFGMGFCGLMMIAQDPQINAAWDEWSAFLDTTELFAPPGGSGIGGCQPSLPGFPSFQNLSDLPLTMVPAAIGGMLAMSASDPPMFSDIQNLMETELIPRLGTAYDRLEVVDNYSDYTFTVTGQMQGDPGEDELELDLTEIYAMEAALLAADAFARILISYNVDFASYDSLGLLQAFSPSASNSFLSLRSGGASNLSTAKSRLLSALTKMEAGISFLKSETDDQNNDIIKIDPGEEADLDSAEAYINYAQEALAGNWIYEADWDDDPLTEDVAVTWNLSAFFDNPIADFKDLIPNYAVSIELESTGWWDWHWEEVDVSAMVSVETAGYYYWQRSYYWSQGGWGWDDFSANISIPGFEAIFEQYIEDLQSNPWIPYCQLSLYWSDYLDVGSHLISSVLYVEWSSAEYGYVVVLTYTDSYQNWHFPNPTFNGLLPSMNDATLKTTFGIGYEDWQGGLRFQF